MVLSLIVLQVVTFVVIVLVMRVLFGSQLKIALGRLQDLHQDSLEKEEILNKELERAKAAADAEIARAKDEAKRIVEHARHSAEKAALDAAERAQSEAKRAVAEAAERGKRMELEVLAGAESKAVDLARELIRYIFTQVDQRALHAQLNDELIEELKKVDKSRLAVHTDVAEVSSALALTPQEKQDLKAILESKLGQSMTIKETQDEALVAGLVIRLGGLVVDGSLKNKLNRALSALHQKAAA